MIVGVALLDREGRLWALPRPNRHCHLFPLIKREEPDFKRRVSLTANGEQGFVNDMGTFLSRRDAWDEAYSCGQVLPPYNPTKPSERCGDVDPTPRELFSEDLW